MADNFQASKVVSSEQSSATKFNNFVQAVEDAINSLDNSNIGAGANVAVSKLAPGSNGQVLSTSGGVAVWGTAAGAPTYQTTLPGGPTDGQETILVDSTSSPTYAWRFRYNATSTDWDFIGGAPGFAEVTTNETTSSATYAALATAGPSFALPVAGDYLVSIGFLQNVSGGTRGTDRMSYDIGGTGAVDADAATSLGVDSNSDGNQSVMRTRKKTGLTAVTLTAKYKTSSGVSHGFESRWIQVIPIKLNP